MTAALRFPKPTPRKPPLRPWQKRRKYMRAGRPRRLNGPGADPARLGFVATLPCVGRAHFPADQMGAWDAHECEGRIEVCHEGKKPGVSMRAPDSETIPMCTSLHRQWTEHRGWFAGWTKAERRAWADERIAETTSLYLSAGSRRGTR